MGRKPTIKTIIKNLDKDIKEAQDVLDDWTFKDYVFVFLFYRFLSDNIIKYVKNTLNKDYIKMSNDEGEKYKKNIIENLKYYIQPSELFQNIAKTQVNSPYLYGAINTIFRRIERSSNVLNNTFKIINTDSNFLGLEEEERSERIAKLLRAIEKIRFDIEDVENDTLGDVYEYFLGKYNPKQGHKTGTFYTPTSLAELAINISKLYVKQPKNLLDPTCGTGSLLINYLKHNKDISVHGIERTIATYCICNMNMLLRRIKNYNIINRDALLYYNEEWENKFDLILANPPFNTTWKSSLIDKEDKKYTNVPLPNDNTADWAFIYPIIYSLNENGVAVVIDTPNMLSRTNQVETSIRKYLVEQNLIDTIIYLPDNLFANVSKEVCMMVIRKNKDNNNILFVNAENIFSQDGKKNILRDSDIDLITSYVKLRKTDGKMSHLAILEEIVRNNYSLELKKYIPYEHKIEAKEYDIKPIDISDETDNLYHEKIDIQRHYFLKDLREFTYFIEDMKLLCKTNIQYVKAGRMKDDSIIRIANGVRKSKLNVSKTGEYLYISAAEMENGRIYPNKKTDRMDKKSLEFIKKETNIEIGDILFAVGEHDIKTVVIEEPYNNIGFNENIYIIKYDRNVIDPYYLRNILESDYFRTWANNDNMANAKSKKVNLTTFKELPIPIIPFDKQKEIGEAFKKLEEYHINIIRKIYCELNSQNSLFRNGISRIGWILKDDK